jgi:hypothetical protein
MKHVHVRPHRAGLFLAAGGSNAPHWLQAFDGGPLQPPSPHAELARRPEVDASRAFSPITFWDGARRPCA